MIGRMYTHVHKNRWGTTTRNAPSALRMLSQGTRRPQGSEEEGSSEQGAYLEAREHARAPQEFLAAARRRGGLEIKVDLICSAFLCEPCASARSFFILPALAFPLRRCEISMAQESLAHDEEAHSKRTKNILAGHAEPAGVGRKREV